MSSEHSSAQFQDPALSPVRDSVPTTSSESDERALRFSSMTILVLLMFCIRELGSTSGAPLASDPAYEVALIALIAMLQDGTVAFSEDFSFVQRHRYSPLLAAAEASLRLAQSSHSAAGRATPPPLRCRIVDTAACIHNQPFVSYWCLIRAFDIFRSKICTDSK
jgi:hypothetical protein